MGWYNQKCERCGESFKSYGELTCMTCEPLQPAPTPERPEPVDPGAARINLARKSLDAERPTTEEGEAPPEWEPEELEIAGRWRLRVKPNTNEWDRDDAYLAGLREGKRLADRSGLRGLTLELAEEVLTKKEAQLASAQAELAKWKKSADESWEDAENAEAEVSRLRELLEEAEGALDYVERRTDPEQKNPTEHHFIRSTRLRGVAVAALARLRSGKDG